MNVWARVESENFPYLFNLPSATEIEEKLFFLYFLTANSFKCTAASKKVNNTTKMKKNKRRTTRLQIVKFSANNGQPSAVLLYFNIYVSFVAIYITFLCVLRALFTIFVFFSHKTECEMNDEHKVKKTQRKKFKEKNSKPADQIRCNDKQQQP